MTMDLVNAVKFVSALMATLIGMFCFLGGGALLAVVLIDGGYGFFGIAVLIGLVWILSVLSIAFDPDGYKP